MKNFLEKSKDVLYNISDYIVIFSIIIGIGIIITWRLDILFPKTLTDSQTNTSVEKENTELKLVEKPQSDDKGNKSKDLEKVKTEEPKKIKVSIPKGSNPGDIADILLDKKLIKSTKEFEDNLGILESKRELRTGKYEIKENASPEEIVKILAHKTEETITEKPKKIKVLIPKGSNPGDIADILLDKKLIKSTKEFEDNLGILESKRELRTGKYEIKENASPEEIVKILAHKE